MYIYPTLLQEQDETQDQFLSGVLVTEGFFNVQIGLFH